MQKAEVRAWIWRARCKWARLPRGRLCQGWVGTHSSGGRWSRGAGLPPACTLAGTSPQNGSGPSRSAGREQAGGPGKGAGCLPTARRRAVCVRGLGTRVPPTAATQTACQAGLLDTPSRLSPPTPFFPPQSSSSGSTDGIRTRVSVGPAREGVAAPLPLECSCRVSWLVPEPQSLCPGDAETHPLGGPRSTDPLHPTPRSSLVSPLPVKCVHPEENAPGPTFGVHTRVSGRGFGLLSLLKARSTGPTPVPANPQILDPQPPHPLGTEAGIPAFLERGKVWLSSTPAHRATSRGSQLPPLGFPSLVLLPHMGAGMGVGVTEASGPLLPTQPLPPGPAGCLKASRGPSPPLQSPTQIRGSQPPARLWPPSQPRPAVPPPSSPVLGSCAPSPDAALGGP